jgi:hypothetical protein
MRAALAVILCLSVPTPALAWGTEAHKFIADRMIDLLPAAIRPLFEKRRAFVIERSVDPDTWRTAGFESEPPNHFLDLDHKAFGPFPFSDLPREYDAAVQKFGRAFIAEKGTLPWRTAEFFGELQRAFASLPNPTRSPYVLDNIVFYSAILAHYASDGHVPLHAAVNYDGQLTRQQGLHNRWESELFERNRNALRIAPAAPQPVAHPRDFMFEVLLASNRLTAEVLAADLKAAEGREFYDDAYFAAFATAALPGLQQRLNESITAVASLITAAWEQAGHPAVPVELPRTPRRIPRP